jgi:hypothetical protein
MEPVNENTMISQLPQNISSIMAQINRSLSDYYDRLQRYGVPRAITQWIFISIVTYVIRNEGDNTGSVEQRARRILGDMRRDAAILFNVLKGYGVPDSVVNTMFTDTIELILRTMRREPGPGPGPRPGPGPGPRPVPPGAIGRISAAY